MLTLQYYEVANQRASLSTLSCLSCIGCADLQEHYQYKTPFPYWSMRHPHGPASCMNVSHVSLTVLALWTPPWTGTWVKNQTVWWEWNPWLIARMWNGEAFFFFFFFFSFLNYWLSEEEHAEYQSMCLSMWIYVWTWMCVCVMCLPDGALDSEQFGGEGGESDRGDIEMMSLSSLPVSL